MRRVKLYSPLNEIRTAEAFIGKIQAMVIGEEDPVYGYVASREYFNLQEISIRFDKVNSNFIFSFRLKDGSTDSITTRDAEEARAFIVRAYELSVDESRIEDEAENDRLSIEVISALLTLSAEIPALLPAAIESPRALAAELPVSIGSATLSNPDYMALLSAHLTPAEVANLAASGKELRESASAYAVWKPKLLALGVPKASLGAVYSASLIKDYGQLYAHLSRFIEKISFSSDAAVHPIMAEMLPWALCCISGEVEAVQRVEGFPKYTGPDHIEYEEGMMPPELDKAFLAAMLMVASGNIAVMRLLVEKSGIDPKKNIKEFANLLLDATYFGGVEAMRLATEVWGLNANYMEEDRGNALHEAAGSGNVAAMHFAREVLMLAPALLGEHDDSVLHHAAASGNTEAMILAKKWGLDPAAQDSSNKTALDYAAQSGNTHAMKLAKSWGLKPGGGVLYWAASSGNVKAMKLAKEEWGLSPFSRRLGDQSILHAAVESRNVDAIHMAIIDFGLDDLTVVDDLGRTPYEMGPPELRPIIDAIVAYSKTMQCLAPPLRANVELFRDKRTTDEFESMVRLAIQAQRTFGSDMLENPQVFRPLFSPTKREMDELTKMYKEIDKLNLITPAIRSEMKAQPQFALRTAVALMDLHEIFLHNASKSYPVTLPVNQERIVLGQLENSRFVVSAFKIVIKEFSRIQKRGGPKIDVTDEMLSALKISGRNAEEIANTVIQLTGLKNSNTAPDFEKALADAVLKAVLKYPRDEYFISSVRNSSSCMATFNLFSLKKAGILSSEMANAIKVAVESKPELCGYILHKLREAQWEKILTPEKQAIIIADPTASLTRERLPEIFSSVEDHDADRPRAFGRG